MQCFVVFPKNMVPKVSTATTCEWTSMGPNVSKLNIFNVECLGLQKMDFQCWSVAASHLQPICSHVMRNIPWAMRRSNGAYGESSQCSLHGWHLTRPLGPRPFAMYLHETDIMYGMYQAGRDTKQWFIRTLVTHLTLYDLNMILDIRVRLYQKSKTHLWQR